MRLLDLFCGCGGASEGYRQAGLDVAVAVDNNELALASHRANHPDTEHLEVDLADPLDFISTFTPGEFDVVHGSPPCRHLSQANSKRDVEQGMVLVHAYQKMIEYLRPRWWIMENVTPILKYLNGFYPKRRVLNAADFGVPQIRRRAICGHYPDPATTHSSRPRMTLDGRQLAPWVSVRQALDIECVLDTGRDWRPDGSHQVTDGDRPAPSITTKVDQVHLVSKHCLSGVKGTRATRSVDDPAFTVATNMSGVRLIHDRDAPGGVERSRDLDQPSYAVTTTPDLRLWTGGGSIHGETRAKLRSLEEPSFTVTKVPGRFLQPVEDLMDQPARCITATEDRFSPGSNKKNTRRRASGMIGRQLEPVECLILQGFPVDYQVLGGKTAQYVQIGNAVPPPVTRAIGLAIREGAAPLGSKVRSHKTGSRNRLGEVKVVYHTDGSVEVADDFGMGVGGDERLNEPKYEVVFSNGDMVRGWAREFVLE